MKKNIELREGIKNIYEWICILQGFVSFFLFSSFTVFFKPRRFKNFLAQMKRNQREFFSFIIIQFIYYSFSSYHFTYSSVNVVIYFIEYNANLVFFLILGFTKSDVFEYLKYPKHPRVKGPLVCKCLNLLSVNPSKWSNTLK